MRIGTLTLVLLAGAACCAQDDGGLPLPVGSAYGEGVALGEQAADLAEATDDDHPITRLDASAQRDVQRMLEAYRAELQRMDDAGERFDFGTLGGALGNSLHKYLNGKEVPLFGTPPLGPALDRYVNSDGHYDGILECYDQADNVLDALKQLELEHDWRLTFSEKPGHYWATATLQQPHGPVTLHLDPWRGTVRLEDGQVGYWDRVWSGLMGDGDLMDLPPVPKAAGDARGATGALDALGR